MTVQARRSTAFDIPFGPGSRRRKRSLLLMAFLVAVTLALVVTAFLSSRVKEPITLTAVGDSITAGGGPMNGHSFDDGSWLHYVIGSRVSWEGGWARGGATTTMMVANVQTQRDADVLVILAGTNDCSQALPFAQTEDNLQKIVEIVGASKVIVSSIPPRARNPELASTFNINLEKLSHARGWEFVDASAGLRRGDSWLPGMTDDGVHPTVQGYRVLGGALDRAVLAS